MAEEKNFFADSEAYERSMGRLSRVAGEAFLDWLSLPSGLRCLDVGCGTGSFTELWLDRNAPSAMYAIDPSEGQIALAKGKPWASRVDLRVGDAMSLPFGDDEFDVAVMALVIQYIPDRTQAMSEITRVVRQGGTVAAYVWPAPGEGPPTQPLQDAVKSIGVSRGRRPGKKIRTIEGLTELFETSGLEAIDSRSIESQFIFKDFDDYWSSQTGETIRDLSDADVKRLKAFLRDSLPTDENGQISYTARANAIRGRVPE
ncbi:MAG: ubiquinone/menaquinone biosynthesis C-methylase UbiE [Alphaproteobacteria bacterium]|jgi:ubiquinone/menaquinone biosynthesis C-methylase UbiE